MRTGLCALAVVLLASGCGGSTAEEQGPPPAPPPSTTKALTTVAEPTTLELFYLDSDRKLVAVSKMVEHTQAPGAAALNELVTAPSGMKTEVPSGLQLAIDSGRATVSGATLDDAALAQVVYSLTTFPTVQSVNGKTRADVEDFAPPILVEHPAPNQTVKSPLHATGTANTFEATFNYRLEDANGKTLAKDFVTATSGSGTRGTFDFSASFTVDSPQNGKLVVFENSAEDGSVIHERVIPIFLVP
jgi:germination protein M